MIWLDLLRHLRLSVLNPPTSTERREVGLAAVDALRRLLSTVASRGCVSESKYTSRMRVVDGALVRVDEEGNEIMKSTETMTTPIKTTSKILLDDVVKEKKTPISTPAIISAKRRLWDDLSTSLWTVFETILNENRVTKDFKDKNGGFVIFNSVLNHFLEAMEERNGKNWWTHMNQVRRLLNLITSTYEKAIIPVTQIKVDLLPRNSKLKIAIRYKRLFETEKLTIGILERICELSCQEEDNNNMNAVRHALFDRYAALLASNSRQIFVNAVAESLFKSYDKIECKKKLKLFESVLSDVTSILERLIAMSSEDYDDEVDVEKNAMIRKKNKNIIPGIVQKSGVNKKIEVVQTCLIRLVKSTCKALGDACRIGHRKESLGTLWNVLLRVSTEGIVVPRGCFRGGGVSSKTCEIVLKYKVRTKRENVLRREILEAASIVAVAVLGNEKGEKLVTRILGLSKNSTDGVEDSYSIGDLFRMCDVRKGGQKGKEKMEMYQSLLMSRCRSILGHFVERGVSEGVSDVLSRLLDLVSSDDGWKGVDLDVVAPPLWLTKCKGGKNHLIYLLPLLVKCVGTEKYKERKLAQACLEAALLEIGFRKASGSSEL